MATEKPWPLLTQGQFAYISYEKIIIVVSLEEFLFCGHDTHRFRIYDLEEGMAKTNIGKNIARKTSHSPTPSYAMPFIMNYNLQ